MGCSAVSAVYLVIILILLLLPSTVQGLGQRHNGKSSAVHVDVTVDLVRLILS